MDELSVPVPANGSPPGACHTVRAPLTGPLHRTSSPVLTGRSPQLKFWMIAVWLETVKTPAHLQVAVGEAPYIGADDERLQGAGCGRLSACRESCGRRGARPSLCP